MIIIGKPEIVFIVYVNNVHIVFFYVFFVSPFQLN